MEGESEYSEWLQIELYLPESYVYLLTPDAYKRDLIWKKGLRRCN